MNGVTNSFNSLVKRQFSFSHVMESRFTGFKGILDTIERHSSHNIQVITNDVNRVTRLTEGRGEKISNFHENFIVLNDQIAKLREVVKELSKINQVKMEKAIEHMQKQRLIGDEIDSYSGWPFYLLITFIIFQMVWVVWWLVSERKFRLMRGSFI